MGYALTEQHFSSFEEVGKLLNEWFAAKEKQFFWRGIHNLPERLGKVCRSRWSIFCINEK
jgi:hypothetical protein